MKKVWILMITLLLLVGLFTACQGSQDSTSDTTETSGVNTPSVTTPSASPDDDLIVKENYTAKPNDAEWGDDAIDFSAFDHFGNGFTVVNNINSAYNGYKKTYQTIDQEGNSKKLTTAEIRRMDVVGAVIKEVDDTAKTCLVELREIAIRVQAEWSAVRARAGTYLMFDFTTNCPVDFYMTVTEKEGGSANSAAYTQGGITVSEKDGKYTGIAKCTVPYAAGKTYYINICIDSQSANYPIVTSIPVEIVAPKYDSPYTLIFQGDWEMIRDENYLDNLVELFYNVYPRVYARFGNGSEPKEITFMADKNYKEVAYNAGTLICVSTDYANNNPNDIGFFAHEITHAVQQYGNKMYYGDGAWWTEFMADLGRFRYFHWGYSTEYAKIYSMSDPAIRDFDWQPYGQHNIFAAYLDSQYPTTVDENGNITYGLVDSINRMIKASKTQLSDDPYKAGTPFNNMVKEVTGFETMEALRLHFVEELDEGTWKFTGYRDYLDNFQTEDIPGIPNPTYPMNEPVKKGDITNPILETPVTDGENLALNATLVEYSVKGTSKYLIENLFDGDTATKWQATRPKSDMKYILGSYDHEFVIDLGEVTTFNTYTFFNASTAERESFNMAEWEVFVSDDGKSFTSIDYQKEINQGIVSVNVGEQSARYVMVRIHKADQNGVGTIRIYEMMLFNKD